MVKQSTTTRRVMPDPVNKLAVGGGEVRPTEMLWAQPCAQGGQVPEQL
jgi:hypothetical protein